MEKEYFTNNTITGSKQPLRSFENSAPIVWNGLNFTSDGSFLDPNYQYSHFESPGVSNDGYALREFISPHKGNLQNFDHLMVSNFENSAPFMESPNLICGSRSFNGRTNPIGLSENTFHAPLMGNVNLLRASSSPSLNKDGSFLVENGNSTREKMENFSPNEESSVSEQIERGPKSSNETNTKKRKAGSRGKSKENASISAKVVDCNEDENTKRSKPANAKTEAFNDETEKQKCDQKPPEPFKDYIHVRARRGQATDSHSLAERVRREKIGERMKLLQDLVPGCNKVTGKAVMLDEIINYVQSLQCQVEFLSMKLSSVNPGLDLNINNILSKDTFQPNSTLPQQMLYPLDSSSPAFYNHQSQQNVQQLMDPLSTVSESLHQFHEFGEDDLHSIVKNMAFHQHNFLAANQTSDMKVER